MLGEVMNYIHNYFIADAIAGEFVIKNGALSALPDGFNPRYILIEDSMLNNGVHAIDIHGISDSFEDETFTGTVCALIPPKEFLSVVEEIKAWDAKHKEASAGVFTSESFNGYSYTMATNANGSAAGWQDAFRSRLNKWRKL